MWENWTIEKIDEEIGELVEDAYRRSPNSETISDLAELYEIDVVTIKDIIKIRELSDLPEELRRDHNKKTLSEIRASSRINENYDIIIKAVFVIAITIILACIWVAANKDTRSYNEIVADELCGVVKCV